MKITSTEQLSAFLKDIRLSEHLSQSDVAKKVGIRQDTVSSFELKASSTKMETFFKILSALELDIEITPRNSDQSDESDWTEEW